VFELEQEACNKLGLTLTTISLASKNTVSAQKLLNLLDYFDMTTEPFVMHCKSGADRTGLAASFYLVHKCGASIDHAKTELSPRYLHFKWTRSGTLDFILDQYKEFITKNPDKSLRHWIESDYDPDSIRKAF